MRLTDREFLRSVLADGEPHSLNEILRRSFRERDCGLTVHSRAAELRREVEADGGRLLNWKDGERGDGSWYRLLLNEPSAVGHRLPAEGSLSGSVAISAAGDDPAPAGLLGSQGDDAAQLTVYDALGEAA